MNPPSAGGESAVLQRRLAGRILHAIIAFTSSFDMPFDFSIHAAQGVVYSSARGIFSRTDALEHVKRLKQEPDFHPGLNQLFDFRTATTIDLSGEEIEQLAVRDVFSKQSKRAFVVSSNLQFGMARMFALYRDTRGETGVQVFRELPEALAWLGLPTDFQPKHLETASAGAVKSS
jgi:hypothetical protein